MRVEKLHIKTEVEGRITLRREAESCNLRRGMCVWQRRTGRSWVHRKAEYYGRRLA